MTEKQHKGAKRVVMTGGHGFLGWHLACRLRARLGVHATRLGRADSTETVRESIADADVIYHLAGVNRADTERAIEEGNVKLAVALADAIGRSGKPVHVVYANSIQADLTNAYGTGKLAAGQILREATARVGGRMTDVRLPNLFGEHGRPHYNSFVATFCHLVASGGTPVVRGDRELDLLHVQVAAQVLMDAGSGDGGDRLDPTGVTRTVSGVLDLLLDFHRLYAGHGELPDLTDPFVTDLFNTYRSYMFPGMFPVHPVVHADHRGELFESSRSQGGTAQTFVSTTAPGATRGNHYHLHKVERFLVIKGRAEISLRRLLHDEIVTFTVDGARPGFVDMPTLWSHNITNVGSGDLITAFWADQLLNPASPDQYPEPVIREVTP